MNLHEATEFFVKQTKSLKTNNTQYLLEHRIELRSTSLQTSSVSTVDMASMLDTTPAPSLHSSMNQTSSAEASARSSTSTQPPVKEKKQKQKKNKQQSQQNGQKQKPKVEKPLYQTLGEQLLSSTRPSSVVKSLPPLPTTSSIPVPLPPVPTHAPPPPPIEKDKKSGSIISEYEIIPRSNRSVVSLLTSRRSEDSTYSAVSKYVKDEKRPDTKYKVKGAIYNLHDFEAMAQIEDLILRYGGVPHMGVRDPSYSFWMNRSRSAVIHFKVLDKVAVLGGDPLCHPANLAESIKEFREYCKQVGWKTAIIGGSESMVQVSKTKGYTTMRFGTETVLNPQTNEVLLGKAGKRIVTQCKQLLDPARGGITIHTYSPSLGRDTSLESELRDIYDEWRNNRNTSRDTQAFITVFDLFAMHNLMTFLYTKDRTGTINGFAALRKLGANNGYHVDPFIQSSTAPRGVSDLLIYSSLSFLHVQKCTYLSLGFEPLPVLGEISGLPSAFHSTTRAVHKHVFGKIPVGGKEAFFARWKPDSEQETPLYLVFVGRLPSPRYMVAMCHYTNISFRQIMAADWNRWMKRGEKESVKNAEKDKMVDSGIGSSAESSEDAKRDD